MAKVKVTLGNRPKNFPHVVTGRLVTGEEAYLPVLFKYRTRTEFGQFLDGLLTAAAVKLQGDSEADVQHSVEAAMQKLRDQNADYLLQVIDGWELDAELNLATLRQLCDEMPGIAIAAMTDYRLAITEGRLGN